MSTKSHQASGALSKSSAERRQASESRLLQLRREAELHGQVKGIGVQPPGAPFPKASPHSGYYGVPLLKQPQWKWEIPVYFFVGGAAGASSVIGLTANLAGADEKIVRDCRYIAAGGGLLSTALLIADLGRPARFLNMLRVFKHQSPMSVGAWTLAAFGTFSGAAAFAQFLQDRLNIAPVRVMSGMAEGLSALFGMQLSNYTGVLIGATAIPVWNENVKQLPLHFGASGLNSAVSILELLGSDDSRALNLLGLLASAYETYEGMHLESQNKRVLRPLKRGVSGWITRTGGALSGPAPLLLRLLAGSSGSDRSRGLRRMAAIASLGGSLLTRIGWLQAGQASAADWRLPLEIEEAGSERPELPSKRAA